MKLIDKNFRILGKINAFDAFVVFAVIFVIISLFVVKPKKPTIVNDTVNNSPFVSSECWLEVYGRVSGIPNFVADLVTEGDAEVIINSGVIAARVEKIITRQTQNADGVWQNPVKKMEIKFLVRAINDNGRYLTRNQYLKVGGNFRFLCDKYDLNFEIYKIGDFIND